MDLQQKLRKLTLIDYTKEKEELEIKRNELEGKREKLLVHLPIVKVAAKFSHVLYLDVRRSPIVLVALTHDQADQDPYQFEPKFVLHKRMISMREKTNNWNGAFYEQARFDFLQDKEDSASKLIEDIRFSVLLKIVDNFCFEEYGRYYLGDGFSQTAPRFRLSERRCHIFNIGVVATKAQFLAEFLLKLAEFVFSVFESSSLFSPSNTKEKSEDSRIAISLTDCSNYKIELEYTAKGLPKSTKVIDISDYQDYFTKCDSFGDFSSLIRLENKATLTMKTRASKSHLVNDQMYEIRFILHLYPPETDESYSRPKETTFGFVLFQEDALQPVEVAPELKNKQVRSRLRLLKTLCQ